MTRRSDVCDLMTAKSLEEKPARQAKASTEKVIRLLAPLWGMLVMQVEGRCYKVHWPGVR